MTALPDWDVVSDAGLALAATAGDRGAFASIYDRYADRLHDFCVGMLRDRDAAADCVQDVFCTAADRLAQLREADKLRPWLYAIARNECLRTIRARGRELARLVADASAGLSDRDREVLELAYRHGLDGPELAEALGVSVNNAKKMAQRLRETIERSLGALLVSRQVRTNPSACPELSATLDGWDGQFTVLMRKRIARHIESCAVCDGERRRMVSPVALLGGLPVFIGAPEWVRERTLDAIQLSPGTATTAAGVGQAKLPPVALFGAALIAVIGVTLGWMHQHNARVATANVSTGNVSQTAPPTQVPLGRPSETTQPAPRSERPFTNTIPTTTSPTNTGPPPIITTVPGVPPPSGPRPSSDRVPVVTPPPAPPTQAPVTTTQKPPVC